MASTNPRYADYRLRCRLRKELLDAWDGRPCPICGRVLSKRYGRQYYTDDNGKRRWRWHPLAMELDEIIPISKGGSPTDRANLQMLHRICNQRKSNKVKVSQRAYEQVKTSRKW